MKKLIATLILTVILISCVSVSVSAAMPSTVEPLWDNTSIVTGTMVFDGSDKSQGTAEMQVVGKIGVTKIEGSVVVYKRVGSSWVYVTENSKTVSTKNCFLSVDFKSEIGYEYKAEFHFVVTKGTTNETIDRTITKTCE